MDLAALHGRPPNSDAASLLLESRSLSQGHLLLYHWTLSLDSFWTSEAPFYAVAVLLFGVHPDLLTIVPAVLAALVVVTGIVIVADGQPRGAAVAGAVCVIGFLAIPIHALTWSFLFPAVHLGAILWSLIAFYAVRKQRWGLGVGVAAVVLAIGMLGDLQTIAYGTGPMLVASGVTMLRQRSAKAGTPALAAGVGAIVIAELVRHIAVLIGSFTIGFTNPRASLHQIKLNFEHLYSLLAQMLGLSNKTFGTGGVPGLLADVHVVGGSLVLACAAMALGRLIVGVARGTHRPQSQLDDMLVIGALGVAASYLVLSVATLPSYSRYLTGTVVFLVILAGRTVASVWSQKPVPAARPIIAAVGGVVLACFIAGYVVAVTKPAVKRPAVGLSAWLSRRHLTDGLGAYWSASITTADSDGKIHVRPVNADQEGTLVRYRRESQRGWYTHRDFRFLVYQPNAPWEGVNSRTAARTWGKPATVHNIGSYRVMVWDHRLRVPQYSPTARG